MDDQIKLDQALQGLMAMKEKLEELPTKESVGEEVWNRAKETFDWESTD